MFHCQTSALVMLIFNAVHVDDNDVHVDDYSVHFDDNDDDNGDDDDDDEDDTCVIVRPTLCIASAG